MEYVVSKDGTRIAYQRWGEGPPLVLVHGTGVDHTYWVPLVPNLQRCFSVYGIDRRGRGQSGETRPYAIEREFEDVVAVVESIPEETLVLGHSYGALCSLEASLMTHNISKMVLNEPPMYTTVRVSYPADAPQRLMSLLGEGKHEEALLMLYRLEGMPTAELNRLRSSPSWQARILAAPTIPREIVSVSNYSFDASRFRELKTPILLLLGNQSLPVYKAATETLRSSLPNSRLVVLPGQQHDAAITAPELYFQEIARFLLGDSHLR